MRRGKSPGGFAALGATMKTARARALHEELQVVLAFLAVAGVLNRELFDGQLGLHVSLSPYISRRMKLANSFGIDAGRRGA